MALPNIFSEEISSGLVQRIHRLSPGSSPQWGKMNVGQMLAHCNVMFEQEFTDQYPKPGFLLGFMLKTFIKKSVVSEQPFKRNAPTSPAYRIHDARDFETEKNRLIAHLSKLLGLGKTHFDNRQSHSFGVLTLTEWNNLFYKHLDHHLVQFGV
ncbi:DUF1569 domain-containing protein [Chitinophaga solisilvae]|uniref:DUF1569 domain-containing protein n=1 Tax=Chitinophaga solisilvae TaxID=1233460 RepID=A0A3S1B2A8_9BACT|nr:DUF1569 domain-containing protein [Chitinophaga solisilvae]NSL90876.1 DUF1569 domain-containing protein [Chitinophaga solisilvae]